MKNKVARVVVCGGGVGGHKIAYNLSFISNVTLVDLKDYFEVPMAAPRHFVNPGCLNSYLSYSEFLPGVNIVTGKVIDVDASTVTAIDANGNSIEIGYDYLVLATGSNYQGNLVRGHSDTIEERKSHYRKINGAIRSSREIAIIGGGAVGVEIAGEIIESFPGKSVTLIEGGKKLLSTTSDTMANWASEFLVKNGVRIILDESISSPSEVPPGNVDLLSGELITSRGSVIPYDMALWCVGAKWNASYMRNNFSDSLDAKGQIIVNKDLSVLNQRNIFAVGDVTNIRSKGALWVQYQVKTVSENIKYSIYTNGKKGVKKYKAPFYPGNMVVTLGKNNGVMSLPVGTFRSGWLARKLKSEVMLVSKYRKDVGLPR